MNQTHLCLDVTVHSCREPLIMKCSFWSVIKRKAYDCSRWCVWGQIQYHEPKGLKGISFLLVRQKKTNMALFLQNDCHITPIILHGCLLYKERSEKCALQTAFLEFPLWTNGGNRLIDENSGIWNVWSLLRVCFLSAGQDRSDQEQLASNFREGFLSGLLLWGGAEAAVWSLRHPWHSQYWDSRRRLSWRNGVHSWTGTQMLHSKENFHSFEFVFLKCRWKNLQTQALCVCDVGDKMLHLWESEELTDNDRCWWWLIPRVLLFSKEGLRPAFCLSCRL